MPYLPIEDDPRLTAFALGEIEEDAERAEVEARLAEDPEAAAFVEDVRRMARILSDEFQKEHATPPALDPARREAVEREMAEPPRRGPWALPFPKVRYFAIAATALVAAGGVGVILMQQAGKHRSLMTGIAQYHEPAAPQAAPRGHSYSVEPTDLPSMRMQDSPVASAGPGVNAPAPTVAMPAPAPMPEPSPPAAGTYRALAARPGGQVISADSYGTMPKGEATYADLDGLAVAPAPGRHAGDAVGGMGGGMGGMGAMGGRAANGPASGAIAPATPDIRRYAAPSGSRGGQEPAQADRSRQQAQNVGERLASRAPARTEPAPPADLGEMKRKAPAEPEAEMVNRLREAGAKLHNLPQAGEEGRRDGEAATGLSLAKGKAEEAGKDKQDQAAAGKPLAGLKEQLGVDARRAELGQVVAEQQRQDFDREEFEAIVENPFVRVAEQPLSTFGVDVDTASYANVRRFLIGENRMPPPDSARIEEMVNYFRYNYAPPQDDRPFSVNVEFARCPWQADHRLLRVGLKGKEVSLANRPPSNLVFLIDVSGSMRDYNKLPWVKESLRMLVNQLVENDRVAIVVYAGNKGLALPSTTGDRKDAILGAIDRLEAGGSTNGGEGLRLAYDLAQKEFVQGGINRIILCTDGDFNTGDVTDIGAVTRLAEEKRATKVKLTVLGYGQGNLQDAKLQALADKGDGQYAYIDTLKEAHRVLVEQMSGTLQTIAKDVKLQLDFNPRFVAAYRLLGYENRMLQAQDFRDDTKDAGDIGAGHTVTALYELVPPGQEKAVPAADGSRFQEPAKPKDDELSKSASLVVNLRYKQPDGDVSTPFDLPANDPGGDYANASTDFKFAASVAEFGLLLRRSKFAGQATYEAVLELAQASQGDDPSGDRKEFLDLVRRARDLSQRGK